MNWKNPQEIERFLIPIDLAYLDFVPEGFDAEVAAILPYNGHVSITKQLTDSLYYSTSKNRELFSNREKTFVQDCNFYTPIRKDKHGHPEGQTKPLLKGDRSVTGQIVDSDRNPIAGMSIRLRMDRYLEHEEEIVTDKNGYFTFSKFYPGEVSIYAWLHSEDTASILWKYCLTTTFQCPKFVKAHTLKKPLVASYSSKVNYNRLSVFPLTNGSFIDPIAIKTLKTSKFQNTFIATREFEQRLQAMHKMKNGSEILNLYVSNLSEPLWKCDEKAARLLLGSEKEIFEEFAKQRLTNVQNNTAGGSHEVNPHQEALNEYYSEKCNAFRKENETRLKQFYTKSTAEINALRNSLGTTLSNPLELASAQSSYKGRSEVSNSGSAVPRSTRNITVRKDSYSFSWSSNSWCNIDQYLASLGNTPWETVVKTNMADEGIIVYKTLRDFQTILGLIEDRGSYTSLSSRSGFKQSTLLRCMFF